MTVAVGWWTLGECDSCGRRYKIVDDHGGECQWCRGWYRCKVCHNAKPLDEFTYHQGDNGDWNIHATCKACRSSDRAGKYENRADVLDAYRIHGRLLAILIECIPLYIENQQRITRRIETGGHGPHKYRCPDSVMEENGVTPAEWLRLAGAMCEIARIEGWHSLPAYQFDPERTEVAA